MFYSPAILAKKGDLSHVWVAAHWHNKLTKQQVQNLDIAQSIKAIKQPTLPLSLRLSGQLLHGVARIHQKKVAYLFTDCNDALVKIKMAFRPGGGATMNLNVSEHGASTPHRINAPALDGDDDEEEEVIPKSSSSRRFKNVEIQVDEDDWTKMTPVHMRKSISRRTPSIDLDYAAAAAAGDGAQTPTGRAAGDGESWSEFPFASSEEAPSSIEVVRRANDSNIRLSTMSAPGQQQQQQEADYVPPDDMIFGDEFHHAAPQLPETPGDVAAGDLQGLLLQQSGSKLKSSWLQDVERRESEVAAGSDKESLKKRVKTTTPEKPVTGEAGDEAPKTVQRSKRAQQIELSNDFIQNALHDTSDICQPKRRNTVRDRIRAERALQQQFGFLPPSSVPAPSFEESSLPLHSALAQKFVEHAKPVPKLTADEVEVARDLEEQSRIEEQQQQHPTYQQEELDVPMDAPPTFGDEYQQAPGGDSFAAAAKHELEETFVEDKKEGGEEEVFVSSSQQQLQGEEERWNPQTIKMMKLLREKLTVQPVIAYQDLAVQQRKGIVAKAFFEVLQLTTRGMVHVSQEEPFGEILISPGQKYDTLLPTE